MRKNGSRLLTGLIVFTLANTAPALTGRWGDERLPEELLGKMKDLRALAVVSFSSVCPLAKRLVPQLNALQKKYARSGIQILALFPNGMDDVFEMAEYALDNEVTFPVYKDDADKPWHEALGMTVTPEVVLLDLRGGYDPRKVLYRGKVDEMWFGGGRSKEGEGFLANAIEAFFQSKEITLKETAPSGCRIAPEDRRDLQDFNDVTYYKDIAPLMEKRCRSCHTAGEPGAELFTEFSDYDTVSSLADTILDRVKNRVMPPWGAIGGNENIHLKNSLRLSEKEINTFIAWSENGLKAGNPADFVSRFKPPTSEWKIGKPDFVFKMQEPYIVPKFRLDEYQYYRIKANFPEDRYIQAVEVRPGNKAVVHHMGAIVGPASDKALTGTDAMMELYGITGDKVRKVGDYVPGDPFNARVYPEGMGLLLPAGTDIVFEMHYTPTGGTEEPDQSEMGIIWADKKPEHLLETHVFNRKDIRLPPNESHIVMTNNYAFSSDVRIYALAPHMHFRGKAFKLYKVTSPGTPEEKREVILKVPTYDFAWQRTYEFEQPIDLKAGDALHGVAYFDNSIFNPNNPDPNAFVRYGIKSEQEMFNMRVKFERVTLE